MLKFITWLNIRESANTNAEYFQKKAQYLQNVKTASAKIIKAVPYIQNKINSLSPAELRTAIKDGLELADTIYYSMMDYWGIHTWEDLKSIRNPNTSNVSSSSQAVTYTIRRQYDNMRKLAKFGTMTDQQIHKTFPLFLQELLTLAKIANSS